MVDITDMGKGDAVTVPAHDIRDVVFGVCVQRTGAEGEAVIRIIDHFEEAVDARLIHEQARQAEDVPRGIVHVDGHFDAGLMAGWHDRFEEVAQVIPELFLGHVLVSGKQLIELCHSLRLPAGEGHVVLLGEAEDILGHGLVVIADHVLLIEQRS